MALYNEFTLLLQAGNKVPPAAPAITGPFRPMDMPQMQIVVKDTGAGVNSNGISQVNYTLEQTIEGGQYDGKMVVLGASYDGGGKWVSEVWVNTGTLGQNTMIGYIVAGYGARQDDVYSTNGNAASTGVPYDSILGYSVVCFTRGTLIKTADGERAIESLTQGDLIETMDNGYQPIRWIGKQAVSALRMQGNPNLRPIRIAAGALGDGLPEADLIVSPQHRVLLRSQIAQDMFGTSEILVAAKQLLAVEGIDVVEDGQDVEYWHFLMDQHEVVFSNGAATESLFTGPEALKSVPYESRAEILALFPNLEAMNPEDTARPIVKGRMVRELAALHQQNNAPLVARR